MKFDDIRIIPVIANRTWSLADQDGLEISIVSGKRRLTSLLAHLRSIGDGDFWHFRKASTEWRTAQ